MNDWQQNLSMRPPDDAPILRLLHGWFARGKQPDDSILHELATLNPQLLIPVLKEALKSSDLELVDATTWVIATIIPEYTPELLLPLLDSPLDTVRWHVCGLLGDHGDERVVLPLAYILRTDPDADVRYTAAVSLERIGDERAVSALNEAIQHDPGSDYEGRRIATAAAHAIQMIRRRSAS